LTLNGGNPIVPVYDNQDRLLTYGTTSYTYGSNGELKTKQIGAGSPSKYTYDALGNLMKVVLPSGTDSIEYLIDGQNRRVGRLLNGVVTRRWLYQNQLNPVGELDGAGNLTRFVYGSRANVPDYLLKGGNVYRLISDHLGSVRLVVDTATGTIAQRIDYDEFGVATVVSGAGFQPFGFAGGLTDSATTLVRFGARDYDPQVGRWTAKDPIGFASGETSTYIYALNDPVNLQDPTGTIVPIIIGAAAAFFAVSLAWQLYRNGGQLGCLDLGQAALAAMLGASLGAASPALFGLGTAAAPAASQSLSRASEMMGTRGSPMSVAARNVATQIGDRVFSGHALNQMQGRGLYPSVVENAIQTGQRFAGNTSGEAGFYDVINNVTVIINALNGTVVTTRFGPP